MFFVSASFLSPDEFGLVGFASSLVFFAIAFAPLAFGEAMVQRQDLSKAHADSVFWMTSVFGMIYILPFLLSAGWIADWMGEPAIAAMLPVLALRIPIDFASAVPNSMIIRSMNFKLVALRTTAATLVSVGVSLSLLFAGYGYWALIISQVSSSYVLGIMAFWASGWRPGVSFNWTALKELAPYGLFASGNHMLYTMKLDHIVLGALAGPHILGLYFFAQRLYMSVGSLVSGALSSVSHVLLSTLQSDRKMVTEAFDIASFGAVSVSTPVFVLLAIVSPDLLALLPDPKWFEASLAIQMFCVVGILSGISEVQGALIRSQGKANWWFYYQLLQSVATALVVLITYRFGISTLVAAIVVKSLLLWPIPLVMTKRILGLSTWRYLQSFLSTFLSVAVMSFFVAGVGYLWPDMPIVYKLLLQCCVAGIAYLLVLFFVSRQRIMSIWRIIAKKKTAA